MPELRIGINPRDAEAGAKRVQAALKRVSGSARTTVGSTKKVESGFESLVWDPDSFGLCKLVAW